LDSSGNIKWSEDLPYGYQWYGSQHMAIGNNNALYLATSYRDTLIFIETGDPTPKVLSQSNDTSLCRGKTLKLFSEFNKGSFSFQWQKNGKNIPLADSIIYEIQKIGFNDTGNYQCIISNCFSSDSTEIIKVSITMHEYFDSVNICSPNSYNFGGNQYYKSGNYSDTFMGYYGCDSIVHLNLSIMPTPITELTKDTFFCSGKQILLNAGNTGATYVWSDLSTNKQIIVNKAGVYSVVIKLDSCQIIDTVNVKEEQSPVVNLGTDTTLCLSEAKLWLDAGQYTVFEWYPGGEMSRTIEIVESGIYHVKVTSSVGCSSSDSIMVIDLCDPKIYIPNAFTPNADGLNDEFLAKGIFISSFTMIVFDRWGSKLFESNDIKKGWNGTFKGALCPVGEYLYIITTKNTQEQSKMFSGTVLLLK